MDLGFDAKRAFHNATGLGNYARDVLRILHRHRPDHVLHAYTPGGGKVPFALEGERFVVHGPRGALGRLLPSLWRGRGVVRDAVLDGVSVFHGLSHELPLGIERTRVAPVVTIHDLVFERLPELYPAVDRRIYQAKARSAVRRARLVVAISAQTRRDLEELYGLAPERIRVVYQTCNAAFRTPVAPAALEEVRRRLEVPERFLLAVGTVERRKNLALAVEALAGLEGVPLLAVGRATPYQDELRELARARGVADRVRFLSGVATPDLAALYRLATVVLYPSRYEGFGIPILEALFSGTPVVTTRGGVFAEVGGPGTVYVDPDDAAALREELRGLLDDPARRRSMAEAGLRHAARFDEAAIADALSAVYEEAARA
jgi:glycosyltransferase involved in cell wall biosynthesis